jgi:peroxiredoxin
MQKTGILKAGKIAPHFTLASSDGTRVSLKTFYGKPIVLVFYPADWSGVCGSQLALYNEILPEFEKYQAQVLAISVDGQSSHMEFAKQRGFKFPLLSDFEPKGAIAKKYGAYHSKGGVTERALFVIAPDGKIAWSYRSPMGVNPGADGILKALAALEKAKGKKK